VLAGTARVNVGVTVWSPKPVDAAALKILVAVGGPAPAGRAYGYAMPLVASVQVTPLSQVSVGELPTVTEFVASVLLPEVNWVEVAVTFQPAPDPVASCTSMPNPAVVVWLVPFSVSEKLIVGGTTMLRVPALMVAVAAVEAEATDDTNGRATRFTPAIKAETATKRPNPIWNDLLLAAAPPYSSVLMFGNRPEDEKT